MVCGGKMDLFIDYLVFKNNTLQFAFTSIIKCIRKKQQPCTRTVLMHQTEASLEKGVSLPKWGRNG
jgi:hypothetical protein